MYYECHYFDIVRTCDPAVLVHKRSGFNRRKHFFAT